MSVINRAKALGWKPPEGLSESQFLESAKIFLRNQPAEKVASSVVVAAQAPVSQLLILTSPLLLAKRDAKGKCLLEFSPKTCDSVTANFSDILILTTEGSRAVAEAAVKHCPRIRVLGIDPMNAQVSTDLVKNTLRDLYNIQVRTPPGAQRTMSYLNIGRFVVGATVTMVAPDEHAKIGAVLDQELDFKAMMKIRSDNDWN